MTGIIYDPDAESELVHNIRYYEARRLGLGLELFEEVEVKIADAIIRPRVYPYFRKTEIQKARLSRFPVTIYFVRIKDGLWIAAIRGDWQDDSWLSRPRPTDTHTEGLK